MAVFAGNQWAWDQADDNTADKLMALRHQLGESFYVDRGVVLETRVGLETITVDCGINTFTGGVTFLGRRLVSGMAPFSKSMLGLTITIVGFGRRVIEEVISSTEIVYSEPEIPQAGGRQFTVPTGLGVFWDGEVEGNSLKSVSAPFTQSLVGKHVTITDIGTKEILALVSGDEITVDGPSMAYMTQRRFVLPVLIPRHDYGLYCGGPMIDSTRVPETSAPSIIRWRLGR